MSYKNPYSVGFEVERALDTGSYDIHSHGDVGAFYNSIMNADLPSYTGRFYSPSEQESMADLKYSKLNIAYDHGLREIQEHVRGPLIEAYIPRSVTVPDGVGKATVVREAEVVPKKTIVDEILKAQDEIVNADKSQRKRLLIRTSDFQQEIHIRRRVRRIEIKKM